MTKLDAIKLFKEQDFIAAMDFTDSNTHNELCKVYLEKCFKKIIDSSRYPFSYIVDAYSKRPYHNLSHIAYCIDLLNKNKNEIKDYNAMLGAIFFHDFIMREGQDEEKSARIGYKTIKLFGKSDIDPEKVYSLIMATEHSKDKKLSGDEAFLHDIDMAILGDAKNYKTYRDNIRLEFADVSTADFNAGRSNFLKALLVNNNIFKTATFKDKLEAQAIINIKQEIDYLTFDKHSKSIARKDLSKNISRI